MQNDFCLPGAPLAVGGAMAVVPRVIEAVEACRRLALPVVWVVRGHHPTGVDVERVRAGHFANGSGALVTGTPGAALVEGLQPLPHEPVVVKQRWSAFFATPLDLVLRRLGVDRLVLAGVQTPNCIRATAYDAVSLDYQVTVLADATASSSADIQAQNLRDLRAIGVATPLLREWLTAQAEGPSPAGGGRPDG